MSQKLGDAWEVLCFNTDFPLPILLYAGYSVKLKQIYLTYKGGVQTKQHESRGGCVQGARYYARAGYLALGAGQHWPLQPGR